MTPSGREGPSATRPGTCPSAAGQSLCAYHPEAVDREGNERKAGERCHAERVDGGAVQEGLGRSDSLVTLPVRHHTPVSSLSDHVFPHLTRPLALIKNPLFSSMCKKAQN